VANVDEEEEEERQEAAQQRAAAARHRRSWTTSSSSELAQCSRTRLRSCRRKHNAMRGSGPQREGIL
jgi:hypothetical protein